MSFHLIFHEERFLLFISGYDEQLKGFIPASVMHKALWDWSKALRVWPTPFFPYCPVAVFPYKVSLSISFLVQTVGKLVISNLCSGSSYFLEWSEFCLGPRSVRRCSASIRAVLWSRCQGCPSASPLWLCLPGCFLRSHTESQLHRQTREQQWGCMSLSFCVSVFSPNTNAAEERLVVPVHVTILISKLRCTVLDAFYTCVLIWRLLQCYLPRSIQELVD